MHHFLAKNRGGLAALAVAAALLGGWIRPARAQAAAPAQNTPAEKKVKDQGEYDIYNDVTKDLLAAQQAPQTGRAAAFTKMITDLDTWKQKYPGSDYKDDRSVFYIQAYAGAGQPAKAVDEAGTLMARDLKTVFNDPKDGPKQQLTVLFTAATAITQIPSPSAEELATATKAAQQLMEYNNRPEGASDTDWAAAKAQLQTAAKGALLYIAMKPGMDAMQKKDFPAAETGFLNALKQYPDSSQVAYQLGASELAQQSTAQAKISLGLYEIARAVSIDPAKSDFASPAARTQVDTYLKRVYVQYHGADDGLDQLRQQSLASPTPPADFHILSNSEVLKKKQDQFAAEYPDLALWMNIKAQLADTNGVQYFNDNMKGTAIPKLKGTLVDAEPSCRPKKLMVAVPMPDDKPPFKTEINLKLDVPLAGKPDLNQEITWADGQPSAFTKDPFLVTIDVEKTKIDGLKTTPCTPPATHHPAKK